MTRSRQDGGCGILVCSVFYGNWEGWALKHQANHSWLTVVAPVVL